MTSSLYPNVQSFPDVKSSHAYNPAWTNSFQNTQPTAPPFPLPFDFINERSPELFQVSFPLIERSKKIAASILDSSNASQVPNLKTQPVENNNFFTSLANLLAALANRPRGSNYQIGSNTTINHYHGTDPFSNNKKAEKELGIATCLAVGAGAIGALFFAFNKLGEVFAKRNQIACEIKEFNNLENDMQLSIQYFYCQLQSNARPYDRRIENNQINLTNTICQLTKNILEKKRRNNLNTLQLVAGVIAAGTFSLSAALLASKALLIAGIATAVFTGLTATYRASYARHSKEDNFKEARLLQDKIDSYVKMQSLANYPLST